jgi:hypothetical protein
VKQSASTGASVAEVSVNGWGTTYTGTFYIKGLRVGPSDDSVWMFLQSNKESFQNGVANIAGVIAKIDSTLTAIEYVF